MYVLTRVAIYQLSNVDTSDTNGYYDTNDYEQIFDAGENNTWNYINVNSLSFNKTGNRNDNIYHNNYSDVKISDTRDLIYGKGERLLSYMLTFTWSLVDERLGYLLIDLIRWRT